MPLACPSGNAGAGGRGSISRDADGNVLAGSVGSAGSAGVAATDQRRRRCWRGHLQCDQCHRHRQRRRHRSTSAPLPPGVVAVSAVADKRARQQRLQRRRVGGRCDGIRAGTGAEGLHKLVMKRCDLFRQCLIAAATAFPAGRQAPIRPTSAAAAATICGITSTRDIRHLAAATGIIDAVRISRRHRSRNCAVRLMFRG